MEETYVAQTETTLTPPPAQEPKKKIPKWAFVIGVLVIAILVSAGVLLLNQKTVVSLINSNPFTKNIHSENTPAPTVTPTADTTNWKTLKSSDNKLSFKYPPDETLVASESSKQISVGCKNTCPRKYNIFNFTLQISNITNLQQFIASLNTTNPNLNPYIKDYQLITINGINAVELLVASPPGSNTGPTVDVYIVVGGIGYVYSYTYIDPSLNSVTSLSALPDPNPNILPTLQIGTINQTTINDISTWKTYTNQYQGVTLQYPPNWYITGGNNINECATFSDSTNPSPDHAKYVFTLCTYPNTPVQFNNGTQVSINGYLGIRVNQSSNWGPNVKVFLTNPKGGSTELGMTFGDVNIFNLMLPTLKFTN